MIRRSLASWSSDGQSHTQQARAAQVSSCMSQEKNCFLIPFSCLLHSMRSSLISSNISSSGALRGPIAARIDRSAFVSVRRACRSTSRSATPYSSSPRRSTRCSTSTAPPQRRTPSRRTYRVGGNPRRSGARSTTFRLSYNHLRMPLFARVSSIFLLRPIPSNPGKSTS